MIRYPLRTNPKRAIVQGLPTEKSSYKSSKKKGGVAAGYDVDDKRSGQRGAGGEVRPGQGLPN